jgi:MFS family permease
VPMTSFSKRGLNIVLCVGCRVVTQLGRFAWSFLILQMAAEFSWTGAEQGAIKAAYAGGYLLTQIPGGVGGARYGNKMFQCGSVLSCALGLLLVPLLLPMLDSIPGAPSSAAFAQQVLFFTGMCCGAQMPTGTALCKAWTLPTEKAWTSSISSIAGVLSSLLSALVVAALADAVGWRATMLSLSSVSFIYFAIVVLFVAESPDSMGAALPASEAALFRKTNMLGTKQPKARRAGTGQGVPKRRSRSPSPAVAAVSAMPGGLRQLFTQRATW